MGKSQSKVCTPLLTVLCFFQYCTFSCFFTQCTSKALCVKGNNHKTTVQMSMSVGYVDWRYSQSCWYFRPRFVNYCPSNLLFGSPPPPLPPFSKLKYSIYRQCVAGRGGGVLSCVGDHILQEFTNLFQTRFRTYKCALPHQTKTSRGVGGLRQINTYRKVPLQLDNDI